MKRITALLAAMLLALVTYSQPISTSVGNLTTCTDNIVVPIEVVKCNNVGAISLTLGYDMSVLTFNSFQNPHPALSTGYLLVINQASGKIYFSWHSVIPLNIFQGTLIEYTFTSAGGYSALNWDLTTQGACEYSDVPGNILPAQFINGSITVVPDPVVVSQPANVELEEGQNASFTVSATNATSYQWQYSDDGGTTWTDLANGIPYSGVTTATLQIFATPVYLNGYQYRCIASGLCAPPATSNPASLIVHPIINTTIGNLTACADEIVVPINVSHFYGVAGISLTLGYNTVVLNYTGVHSSHPALAVGTFFDNSSLGRVYISWFSLVPVNIGDDVLLELSFSSSTPGSTTLVWDNLVSGNCEYNNILGNVITAFFHDGNINVLAVPTKYNVTGGGEYCAGSNGKAVGLFDSQNGITYNLMRDGVQVAQMAGTGNALNFGTFTDVGVYTVYAFNPSTGCDSDMNGSVSIAVNPVPTADAGADHIMLIGQNVVLDGSASGGTPGYTYLWTPGGATTEDATVSPAATTTYTLLVTDSKGCQASDQVTVTVYTNTIGGYVTYNNAGAAPLVGVTVYLQGQGGSKSVMTDVTDANGYYEFPALENGTYDLWVTSTNPWGGVNSTDALLIMEHFINLLPITNPLRLQAADVDASGFINTSDAFNAARRFAQIITSFPAGDWVFQTANITLFLDNFVQANLKGNCVGDANSSFNPNLKAAPEVSLVEKGQIHVAGKNRIQIPVQAMANMDVAAISLVMDMPANLTVDKVTMDGEEMVFTQQNKTLRISWYNTEGKSVSKGQTLFTISASLKGQLSSTSFSIVEGELATTGAQVIPGASLSMPKLSLIPLALSMQNYPNPFNASTQITYQLPAAGNVSLKVYNLLGEMVANLVNGYQDAGSYTLPFDGTSIEPGIYHYRLDVNGEVITRSMVRVR